MLNQNNESHGNELFFFEKFKEWAFYRYINKNNLDIYSSYNGWALKTRFKPAPGSAALGPQRFVCMYMYIYIYFFFKLCLSIFSFLLLLYFYSISIVLGIGMSGE